MGTHTHMGRQVLYLDHRPIALRLVVQGAAGMLLLLGGWCPWPAVDALGLVAAVQVGHDLVAQVAELRGVEELLKFARRWVLTCTLRRGCTRDRDSRTGGELHRHADPR